MNDKYLIISDLDGTLLNSEGKLSKKTIETIKEITKQGHIFCLSTGRPLRGSINIYNQLGLNSIMLNYNGAFISNPSNNDFQPINITFSKDIITQILSHPKIVSNIKNALIEGNNVAYMLKNTNDEYISEDLLYYFHIDVKDGIKSLDNDINNLTHDVNSVLLNLNEGCDVFDTLLYWIKQICPTLVIREWKIPNYGSVLEINSIFANKGTGVDYLSSYYGIPNERIIAFGDGDNDVNMLSKAKYGFAMKNGTSSAKLLSRHTTKHTNDEDGVIWEINYVINKNKI